MTEPATRTLPQEVRLAARRIRAYRLRVTSSDGTIGVHEVEAPAIRIGSRTGNDVVIADETVSKTHVEIVADEHGYRLRDLGSTNGTVVDGYRALDIYLRAGSVIRIGRVEIVFEPQMIDVDVPALLTDRFGPLVGGSVAMRELFAVIEKVAASSLTVIIEGETGAGKEVVARALHDASPRAGGPFIVFDCAAVPASLFESEFFGHERGAFTGATERRSGRMEDADGGTLFLDEVGELPLDLQPKLLRALERREVRRVGGKAPLAVDVRMVAATNRDLAREMNRGAFREDLYYRIAVVRVLVPSLRERTEDIPLLVEHFVRRAMLDDQVAAEGVISRIQRESWKRLLARPWPGNVRELRNVVESMVALGGEHLPQPVDTGPRASGTEPAAIEQVDITRQFAELKAEALARFERDYLTRQLEQHGGNISRAALASGMDRMYFKRLMRKYR